MIQKLEFYLSSTSRAHREGVDGRLIAISDRAIKISTIDFGIPKLGGIRTAEQQHELYRFKKSKADGYHHISQHQRGLALDVYAYVDGAASWDPFHLTTVAAAMLQAAAEQGQRLHWGGFFRSFPDFAHFEIPS